MLWWIAGIGVSFTALAALIYARVQKYGKINAECIKALMTPPMIHQELYQHLEETASRLSIRRKRRLRLPVHFQRRLETLMLRMHRGAADELLPSLQIIRDNAAFIEEEWLGITNRLKRLSALPADHQGVPVICRLCRELVSHSAGRVTSELIIRGVDTWQKKSPLTLAELWHLPDMLKAELLHFLILQGENSLRCQLSRCHGIKTANRLSKSSQESLEEVLSKPKDSSFWEALVTSLRESGQIKSLESILAKLERIGFDEEKLIHQERRRQAACEMWIRNEVTSLKRLSKINWDDLLETIDPVDAQLSRDALYTEMDASSRGYYRSRVQELALKTRVSETKIAAAAVELAINSSDLQSADHVGYYLTEADGKKSLGDYLNITGFRWRFYLWLQSNGVACYRTLLVAGAGAGFLLCVALKIPLPLHPSVILLFSESVRKLLRAVVKHRFPPRLLPRMRLTSLKPEQKTLVVCPTLLTDRAHALSMVRHLSILFHGNSDPNLHFMLLGDYKDSSTPSQTNDTHIVEAASEGIAALNETLPSRFYYYQRQRVYDADQNIYMARERKRGSLESLNLLLTGQKPKDNYAYMSTPGEEIANIYAYVITLDSDTLLSPGAAFQLIGAMCHPLNARKYCVIAPRMSNLISYVASRLSSLWGGSGGTDSYNAAQSDLYQDLFARGSFCGKGIYRPSDFLKATSPFIPDKTVLSHDLLEGELVGSALASDIVLYDSQPATLSGWMKRLHRWTRGDWQLLPFIIPHQSNIRLDALSRQKIWDNLRRSLLPTGLFAMFCYSIGVRSVPLFILLLLWNCFPFSLSKFVDLAALPYKLYISLDAILRTLWRLLFSRRHLLDWIPSHMIEKNGPAGISPGIWCQWLIGAFCFLLSLPAFMPGMVLGLLFALFPFTVNLLEEKPFKFELLNSDESKALREIAKDTFRFFEETVTAAENFLPPDNFQYDPPVGAAHRTSPTNIGFYLLSLVSAQQLGFIDVHTMMRRLENTVETLEKMRKWKGHLYNWYDTRSLTVLTPAFISSVDSGNLCACLMTCAQAVRTFSIQLPTQGVSLSERLDQLAWQMDLSALFDAQAGLFHIGYDDDNNRMVDAHYDLMGSEARLISYVAIMTGSVPLSHWFRLSRPLLKTGGGTMLSWGGTMFEYLMPHLLLPLIPGSLLDRCCRGAVKAQMRTAFKKAWGISESGYYAFDAAMNYQYRAFGLKKLAMNPNTESRVLAPYASALSVQLFPHKVCENLHLLKTFGAACPTGFYEAVDHDPSRIHSDESFQIVKSQMAHHQGMLLCALTNALCDSALIRFFMALPCAQAYQLILEEPMPHQIPSRKLLHTKDQTNPSESLPTRSVTLPTMPPEGQLLSGGGSMMFTDACGNGFMAHGSLMLTRCSSDPHKPAGIHFYIKDDRNDQLWMPTDTGGGAQTMFACGSTAYHREFESIRSVLTCWVDPVDGTFCHLLELEDLSGQERLMETASYFIPVILNKEADHAHPAFRELFIETFSVGQRTLIARRRPREKDERVHVLSHTVCSDADEQLWVQETERSVFLGRNGKPDRPLAMTEPFPEARTAVPAPINPCISLRCLFKLKARQKVAFLFSTQLNSEAAFKPHALEERFDRPSRGLNSLRLAQTHTLWLLRHSGLDRSFLNGLTMLYPLLHYRLTKLSRPMVADENLIKLGVSIERPLILVRFENLTSTHFLANCLDMYRFLNQQGVVTDMLFVGALARERIDDFFEASTTHHEQGRIRWHAQKDIPEKLMNSLTALAAVTLDDQNGPLVSQLKSHYRVTNSASVSLFPFENTPVHPFIAKQFDNSLGGFTKPSFDYVIDPGENRQTPAPWCHMLACEHFGTLVCESGILFSYQGNSHHRRISPWSNDPVAPDYGEVFRLTDLDSGHVCSPTLMPFGNPLSHRVTYGYGLAEYTALGVALEQKLTIMTDPQIPVSIRRWKIHSLDDKPRHLLLAHQVHFILGAYEKDAAYVSLQPDNNCVYARSPGFDGLACLSLLDCSGESEAAEGTAGCVLRRITLEPGETVQTVFLMGTAASIEEWQAHVSYIRSQSVSARMRHLRTLWEKQLAVLQFQLPCEALQPMMNRWLPYQVYTSRLYARAGFYQAGGAIGFRDQLQDMLSLVHTHPARVRAHILDCAAHQFEEGDVQHWWHPPHTGVRTKISDDLLFLPYVTARYIRSEQDLSILEEQIPYLSSPSLAPEQEDRYETPLVTDYTQTLREHCLKAIDHVRLSARGIPLMQGGDWNDGMNQVGGEKGESVWLGLFYSVVLRDFAPYAGQEAERLMTLSDQLKERIDAFAWDGEWYLRAFRDSGEPLGSESSDACRIDSLSQSWAVLADMPTERSAQAMTSAFKQLFDPVFGVMKLLDPPFAPCDNAGYISGYLPGVRENGGQYTHAVPWFIWAMAKLGRIDKAWQLVEAVLPINHAKAYEQMLRYRAEPYVMAGDVYTNPYHMGRGGWTHYTGSAAWLYTVVLEELLGFKRQGSRVRLDPRVPESWHSFSVTYQWGGSTYHLTAQHCEQPLLDGQPLKDGWLRLTDDGRIHQAVFPIR